LGREDGESLKTVAVVIPAGHLQHSPAGANAGFRERLSADEEISYRHLMRFLGGYDKFLVVPESMSVEDSTFGVVRFGDQFFRNNMAYSALLLSADFYRAFSRYKFILIYQLDALVFSDQLPEWCEKDWDYIGAPWIDCEDAPFVKGPAVGNGGLSLRKVESFLKVLGSWRFGPELRRYRDALAGRGAGPGVRYAPRTPRRYRLAGRLGLSNPLLKGILRLPQDLEISYGGNEDYFWSFHAPKYYRGFKIAPVEEGLRFAFEVEPRRCYELNGRRLPFGCHAWGKYDREFWEPYLLK